METLAAAFANAAQSDAGVRFVARDESAQFVSYAELYAGARRVAANLARRGLSSNEVVALILPTCAAFYEAFFGAILLGAVPVALYPPMRLGRLQHYYAQTAQSLKTVGAAIVLTNTQIRRLLGPAMAAAQPRLGCIDVASLAAPGLGPQKAVPLPAARPDAPAFLQFSSGTTSAPKAIALTHRQVRANIGAIAQRLYRDAPLAPGAAPHTAVSWLPLYHDMGLVGCMLTALVEATTLTLIAPEAFVTRPAIWLRTISRYRASVSAAPNFAYSLCSERISDDDLAQVDLSCWQVALNGAEAVSASTMQTFYSRFAPWGFKEKVIVPVYGLAEAGLAVTFASPTRHPCVTRFDEDALAQTGRAVVCARGRAWVSVGTPLEGYDVRIVGDQGDVLPANRRGLVQVRGPSVVAGAAHGLSAPAPVFADGWLSTGDMGFVHDAALYIVGRHKDLIVVRGRNIAPQMVEESLDAIAGVRTGCSVAASYRPPGASTEALVLLVERRRNEADGADAALVCAIEEAAVISCQIKPETVVLCAPGTLPRTSSGKLRRQAALSQYLTDCLVPPNQVSWWRLGLQMLHARAVMPHAPAPASASASAYATALPHES